LGGESWDWDRESGEQMVRFCLSLTMVKIAVVAGTTGPWLSASHPSIVSASSTSATPPQRSRPADHTPPRQASSASGTSTDWATTTRPLLVTGFAESAHWLRVGYQHIIQELAERLNLIGRAGQQAAIYSPQSAVMGIGTSASLNFAGTSVGEESLGGTVMEALGRPASQRARVALASRSLANNQIGAIEATRSPLIEASAGTASPQSASSRFDNLRLVSATFGTLQSALVDQISERLSATPIAALIGFGGNSGSASETNSAPAGGNGGKSPIPASPTAVLTTPLALTYVAPRVTYAQISTAFADITPSIYVPPG
jgi:hypothetical protein